MNPSPGDPMVVACGADAKYSMTLAVTLYSLLTNLDNGAAIELYIVDGGMGEVVQKRLRRVVTQASQKKQLDCRLHFVTVDDEATSQLKELPHTDKLSFAVYLRLLLPDLLPVEFEKVIYVDSDMMFLENLKELWNAPLSGKAVLAVQDYVIPTVSSPLGLGDYAELGYDPEHFYFNSGLLVIDLKRWRDEQVFDKVRRYTQRRREQVRFFDQDGLNAVLGNDCGLLDLRWNVAIQSPNLNDWSDSELKERIRPRLAELLTRPAIVHYTAGSKPWLVGNYSLMRPQWRRFLGDCGWFMRAESLAYFSAWRTRHTLWFAQNVWQKGLQRTPLKRLLRKERSAA